MRKNYLKLFTAFTFIELVISITIVAILSVLGFVSYSKNLEDSRDSQRKSELSGVASGLKVHKTKRGDYPTPGNSFNILYNGGIVALHGKLDENIIISTIDKIPLDPFVNIPYIYSISKNQREFQLSATIENNGINKAFIVGDYKVVAKNILPSISLAISSSTGVEISSGTVAGITNRTKFILNNSAHNLPYTFIYPFAPYSDSTAFTGLLSDVNIVLKNSDYRSCFEIIDDGKFIGTGEYQINSGGIMVNSGCTN